MHSRRVHTFILYLGERGAYGSYHVCSSGLVKLVAGLPALLLYPNSITQVRGVVNSPAEESFQWPRDVACEASAVGGEACEAMGKISENLYENIGASNNRSSPRVPR